MTNLTDLRPTITARDIHELNEHYLNNRRHTLAVGGRYETRNGQTFTLGGLHWQLFTPGAVVELVTGEDETLPDLPVVRAGWPYAAQPEQVAA